MRTRTRACRLVGLATVIAMALNAAACGNNNPRASSAARSGALEFSAPLADGGRFDGTSLAGHPALFWFWAPT